MASQPHTKPGVREQREKRSDGGEPLNEEKRQVQLVGNSLMIGLTDYGVQTHDISKSDTLGIATLPNGIWIQTGGTDE